MSRLLLSLLLALAACTRPNLAYEGGDEETGRATETSAALTEPGGASTRAGEETTGSTSGAGSSEGTSGGALPTPCEEDDLDLAACYHFPPNEVEVLVDGSPEPVDGTMAGVNALVGAPEGFGYAADVGPKTRITVDETGATDDLDVTGEITFMALYWRREAPRPGPVGLLDKQGQYGLFLSAGGAPVCYLTDVELLAPVAPLPLETWTHVACTYDGLRIVLFVNGAKVFDAPYRGPIAVNEGPLELAGNSPGEDNTNLERLDGHIDAVEIWSRALTADEVCARAGAVCEG